VQHILLRIQRAALRHRLGKPQVMYASRNNHSLSRLFGFLALFIGCLIPGLFLYFAMYTDYVAWWPLWQVLLVLLISAAWLAIGVWITFASVCLRKFSVVVCPEGLMYIRGKIRIMRWEQMAEFWKSIKVDKQGKLSRSYTIRLLDGITWILTSDLVNVEELGALIEDEVILHLFPCISAQYLAGNPVSFGAITLTQWGIIVQKRKERRMLPWGLVQHVHLDETSLSLYTIREFWAWETLPIAQVPNAGVLKLLVERVMLDHAPDTLSAVITRYHAGLSVVFGKLSINLQGIYLTSEKLFIPWSDVASIGVGESEVIIRRKGDAGDWYAIPLSLASRVWLLKDFVHYLLQESQNS
jgi:hypothetical protein